MNTLISNSIDEHQKIVNLMKLSSVEIRNTGELIIKTIRDGSKIIICGNGGSAADAQHFAAELTGRFESERRALPALALSTDTSAITAIGNDYGFDFIFSRQLEALAKPGDLLVAVSTSGNSNNVLKAVTYAKNNKIATLGLLGHDGGKLMSEVDLALVVPSIRTARIQEMHILIIHLWCEMLDATIF